MDNLGKVGAGTRNPAIAAALEILIDTENRFSVIPTIRKQMQEAGLPAPVFDSSRGVFRVTLYNDAVKDGVKTEFVMGDLETKILEFCKTPRTRAELSDLLQVSSVSYMMTRYINPLIDSGEMKMTIPNKPQSRYQRYYRET